MPSPASKMVLQRFRHSRKRDSLDGFSIIPPELWLEIVSHLDDAALLSAAGVCRAFNRICSEVHMLQCGASLKNINAGSIILIRPNAIALALATLRSSLHLLPRMKLLSCRLNTDETFFAALRSLCRTVQQAPNIETLHVGVHRTDAWLSVEETATATATTRVDEYANLFHDLVFAMTSKGDGQVVHIDPGTGVNPRGRIAVSSTRKLCHEQINPAYTPFPRPSPFTRLARVLGISKHPKRTALPLIEPVDKETVLKRGFPMRAWLHQHERKTWCNIVDLEHLVVGIVDLGTKKTKYKLALAAVNPHRTAMLRIRRTRWCSFLKKVRHQRLIAEALPYLYLPRLKAVGVDAMRLDWGVFTKFLVRHAKTLEQISSDAFESDVFYPHVGIDEGVVAETPLPNVRYLKARSCAGLLALMNAIPPCEPCTLEMTFDRWTEQFKDNAFLLHHERALLRRISTRTADTTLKLCVSSTDAPGGPKLDEEDIRLVKSLRSVSTVHLSCMNDAVLEWLSYLPALKVLRVDKESLVQPTEENVFLKRAMAAFSPRGISIASVGFS